MTAEGRQPLCALWPVQALDAVNHALREGAHPPTWRLLEQIGAVAVGFEAPEQFANLNTREELAQLEARLTSGRNPR